MKRTALTTAATVICAAAARGHVVPPHPVTEAKTATGEGFLSEGRIIVLVLKSGGTGE